MKCLIFILLGFTLAMPSNAGPGQRYDVQKDNTKVHSSPSATAPVVMRLNKGDRVIEWRRQGSWVKISRLGAVGRDGWIKIFRLRPEASEIEIKMSPNGHFLLQATVNGKAIEFIVDTGATHVMFRPEDAKKLGFNEGELEFSQRANTAGGVVRVAPVVLDEIKIGLLTVSNVAAGVNKQSGGIETSLLGMSFLTRLRGYEVVGKRLILRW